MVDLGIAHLGTPPEITAYAGTRAVSELKAGSAPRQIENLRIVASAIDRLVIATEGEAILNYIRTELPAKPLTTKRRAGSSTQRG